MMTIEWRHKSTVYANRADVVFLINGVPVAIAETKVASKANEQAEALKQSYEDRQLSTQQALAEFEKLAQQIVDAESERQALSLSANAFAVYTALRTFKADLTADQARTIDALVANFPDYKMSTVGNLTLSSELLELPRPLGEYVIVHELVHLLAPNHGKVFKSFMYAYLPDWEDRKQSLRHVEQHTRG